MLSNDTKIVVTGGAGFVGTYVVDILRRKKYKHIFIPRSKDMDLRDIRTCQKIAQQAEVIIHLAANVGGIGYNRNYPADLFYDNLMMGVNLLQAAAGAKVKKLVAIGTVCAYPKYTPVPFREESLWDGYPEETNAPYGLAKKMLLVGAQAYRQQYNLNSIFLLPVNIYGPGDNFSPQSSHVIPALIRKIVHAKKKRQNSVTVWGSGNASREFVFVEDVADAIVRATEIYNKPLPVNIGSGEEISIGELVKKISQEIGYKGHIIWDKTKPDGQPRRLLNTDRAYGEFGFKSKTSFSEGIRKTIRWYKKTYEAT